MADNRERRQIAASAGSDPAGLTATLLAERSRLLRFFTARTGDPAEAEDVLQEIWLRVAAGGSGPIDNPIGYLHRIGLNIVIDRQRERRRRARRDVEWTDSTVTISGDQAAADDPSPERRLEARQRLQRIAAAIADLPEGAARVFRMHRIEGRSHGDIAAELGISRSAVEKRMAVALRHLAKASARW